MIVRTALVAAAFFLAIPFAHSSGAAVPDNPAIDADAHMRDARAAIELRRTRRITEEDFIRMSREPGTIVLDARSARRFAELHVKGAVNLNFSDFSAGALRQALGSPDTRILIYCNNNFVGAEPFVSKAIGASLNVPTFTALYTYGYRNVYELAPLLDVKTSKLEFGGTRAN